MGLQTPKRPVLNKIHDHLYGAEFKVITDYSPLSYVMTEVKLGDIAYGRVASLGNYNFTITHRSRQLNKDADGLW